MTISEINDQINQLNEFDLFQGDMGKLFNLVNDLIIGFPLPKLHIEQVLLNRVRVHQTTERFSNLKDLWYKPKHKVNFCSRLYDASMPLFYCTWDFQYALMEKRIQPGEIFSLIEFSGIENCTLLSPGENVYGWKDNTDDLSDEISNNIQNFKKEKLINDFIRHHLTLNVPSEEDYLMAIATAIGYIYLNNTIIDGIAYPSPYDKSRISHFAIKPDVADKFFT